MSMKKQTTYTCEHCGTRVTMNEPNGVGRGDAPSGWWLAKPPDQIGGEFMPYDLCSLKCLKAWAAERLKKIQACIANAPTDPPTETGKGE